MTEVKNVWQNSDASATIILKITFENRKPDLPLYPDFNTHVTMNTALPMHGTGYQLITPPAVGEAES